MATEVISSRLPFLGSLARSPRPEDRFLWLRVATDYYLRSEKSDAAVSAEFAAHFAACLAFSDDEGRLVVAKKLASRPRVPRHLLLSIVNAGGEAALHVLARAPDFPREDLLEAARDDARARAVARRDDLDGEIVEAILAAGGADALVALAENPLAPLTPAQILELCDRARIWIAEGADRRLAERLLARTPIAVETACLFLEADPARRTAILLAVQRSELGGTRAATAPTAPREAIERLERFALTGDVDDFAATLSVILRCSPALAERIAADRTGEPLAVALAAIGAPSDVSVRILTAGDLRDGADYRRVGALARLRDALSPGAARRIVAALVREPEFGRALAPQRAAADEAAPRPTSSLDRRSHAASAPRSSPRREDNPSPAVLRRRKAFAFLAAHSALK